MVLVMYRQQFTVFFVNDSKVFQLLLQSVSILCINVMQVKLPRLNLEIQWESTSVLHSSCQLLVFGNEQ